MSDTTLSHYGVKGMKWGVRKKEPTDVSVQQKPGKYVKTSGGKRQAASDDAVKAAVSRQKAKSSSLDALSDDELKQLVNRMNMEQNYDRLIKDAKQRRQSPFATAARFLASKEGRDTLNTNLDTAKTVGSKVGNAVADALSPKIEF